MPRFVVPTLILILGLGGTAIAGRSLTPQQKVAATRKYQAKADMQYGPRDSGTAKVVYTGRKASITLLSTGDRPGRILAIGHGRVTVHQKPAIIARKGPVSITLDSANGEYHTWDIDLVNRRLRAQLASR